MRVDNSARSGGIIRISLTFYNMKVCCVFSLESPHLGDSNEYTQYTVFNIKKKIILNYPNSTAKDFFWGLKNEFETAVVNESLVFEPLKFYCIVATLRCSEATVRSKTSPGSVADISARDNDR